MKNQPRQAAVVAVVAAVLGARRSGAARGAFRKIPGDASIVQTLKENGNGIVKWFYGSGEEQLVNVSLRFGLSRTLSERRGLGTGH